MTETTPYTLHLDRSRSARAFEPKESLWNPELEKVFGLLRQQLDSLGRSQSGSARTDLNKPRLSIAIYGAHGSGKTSMLSTLRERVQNPGDEDARKVANLEECEGRLFALPVIKPNLLAASKESFLYAFLATAVQAEHRKTSPERTGRDRERASQFLTPVQQKFQEVSNYLQVLDESHRSQEYDPLGVTLERLQRHTSDLRLREEMRELIDILATTLNGREDSLVLLLVDDPDMDRDMLVNVLDTHRRYLQHPRLVPVVTFTGRLSEELLSSHFEEKLPRKATTSLRREEHQAFEDQIAHQYLSRLFPVRNRVRLGATTVRVQKGRYRAEDEDEVRSIEGLLEASSRVLFGHPEWLVEPRIRLVLRPATLRRQLQIVDAMHAAEVSSLVPKWNTKSKREGERQEEQGFEETEPKAWQVMFEDATWALLDIHRDILKPFDLYLEELYGWPSRSLREWLLVSILQRPIQVRRDLLKRWQFRTENHRGQLLSLLAANAFRPALNESEKVPGQEPLMAPDHQLGVPLPEGIEDKQIELTAAVVFRWFLNVWMGFYLPQLLARDRRDTRPAEGDGTGEERDPVHGVGWHLFDAPVHAMHEALTRREVYSTGMLRLKPDKVFEKVREFRTEQAKSSDPEGSGEAEDKEGKKESEVGKLLILLWCFYGEREGEKWAALSFWRGLALIARLLDLADKLPPELLTAAKEEKKLGPNLEKPLRHILDGHARSAFIPSTVQQLEKDKAIPYSFETPKSEKETTQGPKGKAEATKGAQEPGDGDPKAAPGGWEQKEVDWGQDFLLKLAEWLDDCRRLSAKEILDPLDTEKNKRAFTGGARPAAPGSSEARWQSCVLRRLHAEDLLGRFWPDLHKVILQQEKVGAWFALRLWSQVLMEYWQLSGIHNLLKECPIFTGVGIDHLGPLDDKDFLKADYSDELSAEEQAKVAAAKESEATEAAEAKKREEAEGGSGEEDREE